MIIRKPREPQFAKKNPAITIRGIMKKLISIHFAHVFGHCSESSSRSDNSMVKSVVMNKAIAINVTAIFSSATPIKIITPATNGQVTKAITGYFHPRYK